MRSADIGPPYFWTAHSLYAEILLTAIQWHSSEFQVQDYAWVLLCSSNYWGCYCATPECQCHCGAPTKYGIRIYCAPPNIVGATVLLRSANATVLQQSTDILCFSKLRVLLCYSVVPVLPCSNKELVYRLWSPKLRIILCSPNEGC